MRCEDLPECLLGDRLLRGLFSERTSRSNARSSDGQTPSLGSWLSPQERPAAAPTRAVLYCAHAHACPRPATCTRMFSAKNSSSPQTSGAKTRNEDLMLLWFRSLCFDRKHGRTILVIVGSCRQFLRPSSCIELCRVCSLQQHPAVVLKNLQNVTCLE